MNPRTLAASVVLATALSATTALAPAEAAPRHHAQARAGAFTVTLKVNKTEPLVGSNIKLKGTVKPAAPGKQVLLQVRYAGQKKWKTVGHDALSGTGRFKFKEKVSSVRERKYRVVKKAGGHRAAGHSKSVTVTVYGWRDLTSLSPATVNGFGEVNSVSINGVAYPNSIQSYPFTFPPGSPNAIEYNLNRGCKAFRSIVGLSDSSSGGGSATIQLSADGVPKYSGTFSLTQSAPVAFDTTKVFRLTVGATLVSGGVAALGTPQVLCNS